MRLTNQRKMMANLVRLTVGTDQDDRPTILRTKVRTIYYRGLGVTSDERYLSMQAKTDVTRRIGIRQDNSINEKDFGITIGEVDFNITRIYLNEPNKEMELSLSRVN